MADPVFVSTFECIGIYWQHAQGGVSNPCDVQYRKATGGEWKDAPDLWYDDRDVSPFLVPEYRGSIINLEVQTAYDIKLTLDSGPTVTTLCSTWNKQFPVGDVVELSALSNNQLNITAGGTVQGYKLYKPAGASAVIDVQDNYDFCIKVTAPYVIIRGLTLKGATQHGIEVNTPTHDLVIEENEITNWGRPGPTMESGIRVVEDAGVRNPTNPVMNRMVIQRNTIHTPRYDSTNWDEGTPSGPYGINFRSAGSNHVIRYNTIYGDADHYFKDGMGGSKNYSYSGFPRSDSDIYGNHISHCWDDGIEAEGGNKNVRIWQNFIDKTYVKIAIAATSVGPCYVWRNISKKAEKSPAKPGNGVLFKMGGAVVDETYYGDGRIYIFHHTILQPDTDEGCFGGLSSWGGDVRNVVSRNNILHVGLDTNKSINEPDLSSTNDFDWDLYNGVIVAVEGSETNGIEDTPTYAGGYGYSLDPSSSGYDDGLIIANFNDDYRGAGPDMGAQEAGAPLLEFGIDADIARRAFIITTY